MSDTKISQLTNSLTKATVATTDILPIVDTSANETKKITYQEVIQPTDANFRIAGSADNTKLVAFEVDGLTTATTRTITVPDADLTLVGLTTTQTLTNKTLTAPQINFGSDANGDIMFRNGSGVSARLAIGSTDQILAVQAGLPAWIANPSASAASDTVSGIVELATTAETTTGTDATRAVTPDGLHDMTSLSGAAWFLDEDTMSSDSATKTASQQSIKAYADAIEVLVPNTNPSLASYLTYQIMPFSNTNDQINSGMAYLNVDTDAQTGGAGRLNLRAAGGVNPVVYEFLPGIGSNAVRRFEDIDANAIRIKFRVKLDTNLAATEIFGFGLVVSGSTTDLYAVQSSVNKSIRFVYAENSGDKLYAVNANGTTNTSTDITGALTLSNWLTLEMVITSTSIKYYTNGTLAATHTTNLPTSGNILFGWGIDEGGSNISTQIAPTTISLPIS